MSGLSNGGHSQIYVTDPGRTKRRCGDGAACERLLKEGPRATSDVDLLSALLGSAARSRRTADVAGRLLDDGGLAVLAHATPETLRALPSIGTIQVGRLLAAIEIGRRVFCRCGPAERPVRGPEDVSDRCRPYTTTRKEHFVALHLNTRHVVVREELVSVGSLSASIVHPREVFRTAILETSASLILVHNHPSGDPTPSDDDIQITMRLAEVGELVGIPVVDHVVLGDGAYYSFRESKLLR
jgi:DNA repair protein RadC